jgi:hypothetical protein
LTVAREVEPGRFDVVETIPTQRGARIMTLDSKTHCHYLSAASPSPAPAAKAETKPAAPGKGAGRGRGMVPGSIVVLVVSA